MPASVFMGSKQEISRVTKLYKSTNSICIVLFELSDIYKMQYFHSNFIFELLYYYL